MSLIGKLENDFKSKFIARTEAINLIAKTENDNIYNAIRLILHFGIADKLEMFTLDGFKLEAHGEDYFKHEYLSRENFFYTWITLHGKIKDYYQNQETGFYIHSVEEEFERLWHCDDTYWLKDDFFSNQDVRNILKLDEPSQDETQKTNNEHELSQDETQKTNSEYEPSQDEINHLTTELQQAHSEIDRLKAELEQAQTLLAEKPKIEYVEVKDNRLETLLDEQGEHYAPDLAHAVNLWLSLYGNGKIKNDSHTNLSQVWIKHNTGYQDQQDGFTQAEKRIREITTPFKEWATARNKNYKK